MYKPEIVFTGKDIARTISDARGITRKQAGEYVDSVFEAMKNLHSRLRQIRTESAPGTRRDQSSHEGKSTYPRIRYRCLPSCKSTKRQNLRLNHNRWLKPAVFI